MLFEHDRDGTLAGGERRSPNEPLDTYTQGGDCVVGIGRGQFHSAGNFRFAKSKSGLEMVRSGGMGRHGGFVGERGSAGWQVYSFG
jgi:hypothetical protein